MPFRSEKQRRFLWAAHPDIARRWAHEYPQKKKLPMYAKSDDQPDEKAEKKSNSILDEINKTGASVNDWAKPDAIKLTSEPVPNRKEAGDRLIKIDMPECEQPTYAGQEGCGDEVDFNVANSDQDDQHVEQRKPENAANSILQKMSAIIAPALRQKLENVLASREGRDPRRVPKNNGFHRYLFTGNQIPPPIGMGANPVPPAQNLASAQPQNPNRLAPVGGGSHPQANVINSFGALSSNGNLNGNAAFGAKNSPDSSKISSALPDEKQAMKLHVPMCPCGCGEKAYSCKCPSTCQCRNAGQPCGKYQKKADCSWLKSARCWAGYEPVPGKKPYSEDSCRPAGSGKKKQKKETEKKSASTPAWQREAGQNEEGGLNAKGRASYNKSTGGNLKPPVTEKNPTGERKSRRASFCARMGGMKKKLTGADTANDPDSRINKALRKWNC